MSFNIEVTSEFEKELKQLHKKYPSLKHDYNKFLQSLEENPTQGISLGNNFFKVRISITSKGKGKSGGARIITCVLVKREVIYLVSIYDKSEKESISDAEIKARMNYYFK
jgi:mRNA-degrading endonuclease RelE of RelBE toxin-antitoxin system